MSEIMLSGTQQHLNTNEWNSFWFEAEKIQKRKSHKFLQKQPAAQLMEEYHKKKTEKNYFFLWNCQDVDIHFRLTPLPHKIYRSFINKNEKTETDKFKEFHQVLIVVLSASVVSIHIHGSRNHIFSFILKCIFHA